MTPRPQASLIRHTCSAVLVACVVTLVVMAAKRVDCRPMFGIAIGVGTVAAIIGGRQPA